MIKDVDECEDDTDNCSQICNNIAGSFQCDCQSGYDLQLDGVTCLGKFSIKSSTLEINLFQLHE